MNVLNLIANQGLRLCSSAYIYRTSIIDSIKVKTGEQLFHARRVKLIFFYTKAWRIYVSNLINMFRHTICCAFSFLKPSLVFSKDVYYYLTETPWCESYNVEWNNQRTGNAPKEYGRTRGCFSFSWMVVVNFSFLKPSLVFSKDVYYHLTETPWCESYNVEWNNQRTGNAPKEYGRTRGCFSFFWMVVVY